MAATMNSEEKETFTIPLPLLLTFVGKSGGNVAFGVVYVGIS